MSQGAARFSPDWEEGTAALPSRLSPHILLLSPDVSWKRGGGEEGVRAPGSETEQRAMSNASASPMWGVSYKNSGFLTPQASTNLHPEKNARRPLIALWPATPWTHGDISQ